MAEIPKAVVERLLKDSAGIRISGEATRLTAELAEDVIRYLGGEGAVLAKHAKRSTLMPEDLMVASRGLPRHIEEFLESRKTKQQDAQRT